MNDAKIVHKRKKERSKRKMSIRKLLGIIFGIGILLCGIGVGVSIMEYSSFQYLGKKSIGGNDVASKTITEDLYRGSFGNGKVYVHSYYGENKTVTIETSKDVPKNKIQFIVEYNPNNVKDIIVDKEEWEGEDAYYYVTYMVNAIMAQDNSMEVFFTYKDEILENIKEKRFYEYEYPSISSIKVLIHPSNKEVVFLY